MRGRLDFRRRITLTAFVASLALALMVPGGARAATLAQVRSQLAAWHLQPPPLFAMQLPASFNGASVTLDRFAPFDFDVLFSKSNCAGTSFCVSLRRGGPKLLTEFLQDPVNTSVRQVRIGNRSVYLIRDGPCGAPACWRGRSSAALTC